MLLSGAPSGDTLFAYGAGVSADWIFIGAVIITVLLILNILLTYSYTRGKKALRQIDYINKVRKTFYDADRNIVYLKDADLRYSLVNRALTEFYGIPESEIVGKTDFELNEPEVARRIRETDEEVLAKNTLVEKEFPMKNRILFVSRFPVEMPDGRYGVGSNIRDITEERAREEFNRKVYERNDILVNIFSLSFADRYEQMDYALNKLLGLTDSQFGYIYYYDEATEELVLNSWTGSVLAACAVAERQTRYKLSETGLWGEVVRQKKPIIVNDFLAPDPLKKGWPEGHVQLHRYMSVPIFADGKIVAVVGLANRPRDYDENDVVNVIILMSGVWQAAQRKEALEQLSFERHKYLQTIISIGDGVLVVDKAGRVEMLNSVAQRMTGWSIAEAAGKHYSEVFTLSHELPGQTVPDVIADVFATNQAQMLSDNAVLIARDGTRYSLEDSAAPILNDSGESDGVVLVFRDVDEKRTQKRKIEYLSFHDELTGLYNRRFFEEELRRLDVERNLPISIMMADVNNLKVTNDAFGHASGDELLKTVADVFLGSCRADDVIARWGGDEFVFLLPQTSWEEAGKIAGRLKEEVSQRRINSIKSSISIGFGSKNQPGERLTDILDDAEAAMYAQKTLEADAVKGALLGHIIDTLHKTQPREKAHAENTRELCRKFGNAMGLNETELQTFADTGYLHDIGKAVLPPELLEPGRSLTTDEAEEVKTHPMAGYRILNASTRTLSLADIVLCHHENWDGSGYPKGLSGKAIPFPARMLSIAEFYERTLNSTGSPETALQAVKDQAGTRFDPSLATRFVDIMAEPGEGRDGKR